MLSIDNFMFLIIMFGCQWFMPRKSGDLFIQPLLIFKKLLVHQFYATKNQIGLFKFLITIRRVPINLSIRLHLKKCEF